MISFEGRGERGVTTEEASSRDDASFLGKTWPSRSVTLCVLAFRLANACVLQTSFEPDEYWQSLEVAHHIVFGYGHLTWEWIEGIRGYTHPLLFAVVYWLLRVLGLDNGFSLSLIPRIVMGLFAALTDVCVYRLTAGYMRSRFAAGWALLCSLTSWFAFYCMPRTLANSLEAALMCAALSCWLCSSEPRSVRQSWISLSIAALAVLIRPTSAVVFLLVFGIYLVTTTDRVGFMFRCVLPISVITGVVSVGLDSYFYGKLTFVQWNFFRFNVFYDMSSLFGSHSWHWYLSQGIPVVLGTHLPLCLLGVLYTPSKKLLLFVVMCLYVFLHSFISHKEFRFMTPLVPLASVYAGYFCSKIATADFRLSVLIGLLVVNMPVALYTSMVHQRGSVAVMRYLDREAQEGHVKSVLLLMPCHSTPLYSHFHHNISIKHLDCSPSSEPNYVEEADYVFSNPLRWLNERYPEEKLLPSHLVMYDPITKHVQAFTNKHNYSQAAVFFHSHFPEERIGQFVIVYYRDMPLESLGTSNMLVSVSLY